MSDFGARGPRNDLHAGGGLHHDAALPEWKAALMRSRIPERMHGSIGRWIVSGVPPGSFLRAVIRNDFADAVVSADDENILLLKAYVAFFYNDAPTGCWGSPDVLKNWKGLTHA